MLGSREDPPRPRDRRTGHRRLKGGALTHVPSGSFAANGAWLVMAAIAFNLTRAAGTVASVFHAKATTATIRRQLIAVPGRLARSARRLVIHLDIPVLTRWLVFAISRSRQRRSAPARSAGPRGRTSDGRGGHARRFAAPRSVSAAGCAHYRALEAPRPSYAGPRR
jgi:hypothetical protein